MNCRLIGLEGKNHLILPADKSSFNGKYATGQKHQSKPGLAPQHEIPYFLF
jgi:hypothetical protein